MKTQQLKDLEELEALAIEAEGMQQERKLQRARESFEDFCEMAIKDEVTGKSITLAPLHRAWIGHMRFCLENELNCLVLAPMGSGKTQLFGIALPVYLIGSNPNIRLKLIGLSDDSAKERLASIRTYIAHDEDVKAIFPKLKPDEGREWTKHRLFVERTTNAKDASIDAKGVTSTGIGGRCDYLLADDLGDYNSVIAQPAKRDAINNTFKIVWLTRIEPTGSAIMIATRWHERDLAGEIINDPEVRERWGVLVQRVSEDFESIEQEVIIGDKYAEAYARAMDGFDIRLDVEG